MKLTLGLVVTPGMRFLVSTGDAFRIGRVALLISGLVVLAGCASDRPEHGPGGRPLVRQANLKDTATFFDGAVTAEISLQAIDFHSPNGEDGRGGGTGGHRSRHSGHRGGGGAYSPPSPESDGDDSPAPVRRPIGPPPRIELRGKFTNTTNAPIQIAVRDVVSALGNFAIRPEVLSIPAGATAEIDPLPSAYSETIDELSVDVRVRYNGKSESHTLRLR